MATWISPSEVYAVGKEVTLYPYEPVRPHGMPQYDRNCLPSDLRPGELRDFAKPDKKLEAKIRITEAIRIDQNRYSQIFACEVVAVPRKERPAWYQQSLSRTDKSMKQEPLTRKLVCKTIDAQFFPSSFGGPYSNSEEADGLLSRIHAAYAYYRWNKKTGYPHTMPQFYGGWAMKVAGGMDEKGHTVSRHVGLVLIEHIDGFSVEDLCIRDDDDQDWGTLAPRPGPVRFRTNGNEYKNITFDLKTRQLVMQQAIHGVVQGFQLGVEHHDFGPWNIFVTMRDGYQGLRELRVVILDHNDTQVWYETKYAKKSGRAYCLQKLPHPVHPAERCSAVALEKWRGFWPPTSDQCSGADADKQFAAWLRHKDVFGPKVEAKTPPYRGIPDENLQSKRSEKHLKKSVVQRPYAQKTYSTFDTLDLIGEREDAIDNPIIPTIMGELGVQDKPEEFVKGIEMALRRAFLGGYQMKSEVNGSPYPGPDHIWWKAWRDGKPAPHGPTSASSKELGSESLDFVQSDAPTPVNSPCPETTLQRKVETSPPPPVLEPQETTAVVRNQASRPEDADTIAGSQAIRSEEVIRIASSQPLRPEDAETIASSQALWPEETPSHYPCAGGRTVRPRAQRLPRLWLNSFLVRRTGLHHRLKRRWILRLKVTMVVEACFRPKRR